MNRKSSTLLSLGISAAIIAAGVWFLSNHHLGYGYGRGGWGMPHNMMNGFGMWGGGFGGGGIMIVFWVALIAAVALVVTGLLKGRNDSDPANHHPNTSPDAVEILKQRYARGEIDKEQYESMLHDLS